MRSDTSQPKTPVSDPEKIIHRRSWKEKKSVCAEIPELSEEYYPSSSSQEIQVENPDSTEENLGYYSDSPPREALEPKRTFVLPLDVKLNKLQK